MYNLIKYSDNYSETSAGLWQYYRNEPSVNDGGNFAGFAGNSTLIKFEEKITGQTGNDGTKNVEIVVPLKYLSNFWRTFKCNWSIVQFILS